MVNDSKAEDLEAKGCTDAPQRDGWKSCCYAPRTMIGNG